MLARTLGRTTTALPVSRCFATTVLEEVPGLPALNPVKAPIAPVQETKLSTGLTVVSQDGPGHVSTVGVYVRAGSRYETTPGVAHFLQHMAFKTTHTMSSLRVQRLIEEFGGKFDAHVGHELLAYEGSALRDRAPDVVDMLAETVLRPRLRYWEVDEEKSAFTTRASEAIAQGILEEGLLQAAFGTNSPLGHTRFANPDALDAINDKVLFDHLGRCFNTGNMVVAASNVDHAALCDLVSEHFVMVPEGAALKDDAPAFVGKHKHVFATTDDCLMLMGFADPAGAPSAKSYAVSAVVQALVGPSTPRPVGRGVGAASGLPARLPASFVASGLAGTVFSSIDTFSDANLMVFGGVTHSSQADRLVDACVEAFKGLSGGVSADELARGKRCAALTLMAAVEPAQTAYALGKGALLGPGNLAEVAAAVDSVTADDVAKFVKDGVKGGVAVSTISSDEDLVPGFGDLKSRFA